jgi:hypothetical protein
MRAAGHKEYAVKTTISLAALTLAVALAGCAPASTATTTPDRVATPTPTPVARTSTQLSAADVDGLMWMREEEKLARDIYLAMDDLWGAQVFSNIAASEQRHMDAVGTLLDRYGVTDPLGENTAGEFTNPDLQALYDQLLARGSESLDAAIQVGITIEQVDIADLQDRATDVSDIAIVYSNLERGSNNHLRAFTRLA